MYNWPKEISPEIFAGKQIEAVTIFRHSVSLLIDEIVLSINLGALFIRSDANEVKEYPPNNEFFPGLVGREVVNSDLKQDSSSIVLSLDDGSSLEISGESQLYECYEIVVGESRYIV